MYENVIELNGCESGPTSLLLIGVHGNENCGIVAINSIVSKLKIERGKLFIIFGNPKAIEQNKRFIDVDLNRLFRTNETSAEIEMKSYEYSRAQYIKKYMAMSDYMLDIHASNTRYSPSFIICEENAMNIVKYIPVPLVVSGFDKLEPGGTDCYMNNLGKVGICVECGYVDDVDSIVVATESIKSFLIATGNIVSNLSIYRQLKIQMNDIYLTKSNSFILKKEFSDFEEVKEGQVIGCDDG